MSLELFRAPPDAPDARVLVEIVPMLCVVGGARSTNGSNRSNAVNHNLHLQGGWTVGPATPVCHSSNTAEKANIRGISLLFNTRFV